MQEKEDTKDICQIILLCGYLGSGKTTMIQNILKNKEGLKVAVIQNEFSDEMGIEAPLMKDSDGAIFNKFYELPNGCICCTAKTDLMVAIDYLIQQENYDLQYILIENNGLADPSQIIKSFWVDDELKYPAQLKSVKSILASHKVENLMQDPLFIKQIIFSDVIYMNHSDQIDQLQKEKIITMIKEINQMAQIIHTKYSLIDIQEFFNKQGFQKNFQELENLNQDHVHANQDIQTYYFVKKNHFELKSLEKQIGEILWEHNHEILRSKGIISIKDCDYIYSFQGVEDVFEILKTDTLWDQKERLSKFLFIGKNLDRQQIYNNLKS